MKSILIRDVNQSTLDALKRLARFNNRSLQGELHELIDRAAEMAPRPDVPRELNIVTVDIGADTTWRREEIYSDDGR